jgi:hypothetical protein
MGISHQWLRVMRYGAVRMCEVVRCKTWRRTAKMYSMPKRQLLSSTLCNAPASAGSMSSLDRLTIDS